LRVEITKRADGAGVLRCVRDDGSVTWQKHDRHAAFFALHDLTHYAVETTTLGVPLLKPPYGRITAIDLNTGDHAWIIPNGTVAANILNNPALKAAGIDASNFGGADKSPLLVTKTLLIGGGNKFRAIDKKTGRVIHEMELSGAITAVR